MEEKVVKETLLYIPVGSQDFAIGQGAIFKRKSFFDKKQSCFVISGGLSENKAKLLSEQFGEASKKAKEKAERVLNVWKKLIAEGDNFDCLRLAKEHGFPKDEKVMGDLFLKFMNRKNGDYPVSWEHLCEYIPEFAEAYGEEKYLELHREHNLSGDIVLSIRQSKMKDVEKYFLYFVYETNC